MRFGLFANFTKERFWAIYPDLLEWFESTGQTLNVPLEIDQYPDGNSSHPAVKAFSPSDILQNSDMLLVFGGDGTMLRTVQQVNKREIPILGINVGGLGFLTQIPLENCTQELEKILKGRYSLESRRILECRSDIDDKILYALNEILIDKGGFVRVIEIETNINGQFLNSYVADGILVSTATGSTGYSLSSGGPIVSPDSDVFIVNPICPHSLTNRPIIIPASAKLDITVRTEHDYFLMAADGQEVRKGKSRNKIQICKAPFCAKLVVPEGSHFFQVLHSKLGWGNDFRDKERWSFKA